MAAKQYIAVDSDTRVTGQRVKMTNTSNEFTGKLLSADPNGGQAKDVRELFISKILVDGQPVDESAGTDGRTLNIHIPDDVPLSRVFGADDPTGTTPLEDLTLTIGGTVTSETPSKGDVLVVSHQLPNESYERSAYVHDGSEWVACEGNVDASKVILTQNITMAGNYDKVGNFTKTTSGKKTNFIDNDTKGTAGISVYELIKQMLSKTVEPKINAYPYVSLTVTNTSYDVEYGSTVTPSYSVSYTDGNYKFDGGSTQAAGCARTSWIVTGVPDGTSNAGSTNSITATSSSQTLTVKAKATYNAGTTTPTNNLGDPSDIAKIPAGTTTEVSKTVTVTAYRKNFWLAFNNANMVDLGTVALDGTDSKLNSTYIRRNGHGQKANFSSIPLNGVEFQQVLIFLPKSSYLNKKLSAKTANNLPYIEPPGNNCAGGTSSPKTITIAGEGSDAGVEYCIWEIKAGSPVNGDTIALAWA